jgi:hypothetical protein
MRANIELRAAALPADRDAAVRVRISGRVRSTGRERSDGLMDLALCNGCDRHVRAEESTCPFCGAALSSAAPSSSPASSTAPSPMRGRSRSTRYALHAAALLTATACGSTSLPPDPDASTGNDGAVADGSSGGDSATSDGATIADAASDGATDSADTGAPDTAADGRICCPPYGCVFPCAPDRATV